MVSMEGFKNLCRSFVGKEPKQKGFEKTGIRDISARNDSQESLKLRLAKQDEAAKSKPNLPKSPTDSTNFSSGNSWTTHSNLSQPNSIGSWDNY